MKKPRRPSPPVDIVTLLAVRAFGQGFLAGADPRRAFRRHIVDGATHEHWRKGFDAGRDAIYVAEQSYGRQLVSQDPERRRTDRRRKRAARHPARLSERRDTRPK